MRVVFTEVADKSYDKILDFLAVLWTQKEMEIFTNDVQNIVDELKIGNYRRFQKSNFRTRSALIGKKHVRMYFRQDEDVIKVLLFFDARQNPQKIIELLE